MTYAIVTDWINDTQSPEHRRVTKLRHGFQSLSAAEGARAAMPAAYHSAPVLEEPADPDLGRWFVDDPASPLALEHIAVPEPTDSEKAAGLVLRALDFYQALWPVLEQKGFAPTAPLRSWMIDHIVAISESALAASLGVAEAEAAVMKRSALNRLDSGYEFWRSDPQIIQFAALFSISAAEIDTLYLTAVGN